MHNLALGHNMHRFIIIEEKLFQKNFCDTYTGDYFYNCCVFSIKPFVAELAFKVEGLIKHLNMKKIPILAIFFLHIALTHCYSQTKKGTILLSGKTDLNFLFSKTSISMDSVVTNQIKDAQFGFDLGAGYFVADDIAIALSATYDYNDSKFAPVNYNPASTETITTTLALIPQLIYYFPVKGKIKPSLTIGAGYTWLKERSSTVTTNNNFVYSLSGPSYNAAGGISYFITKSVAFDMGIQYTHNKYNDKLNTRVSRKQNAVAGMAGVTIFLQ